MSAVALAFGFVSCSDSTQPTSSLESSDTVEASGAIGWYSLVQLAGPAGADGPSLAGFDLSFGTLSEGSTGSAERRLAHPLDGPSAIAGAPFLLPLTRSQVGVVYWTGESSAVITAELATGHVAESSVTDQIVGAAALRGPDGPLYASLRDPTATRSLGLWESSAIGQPLHLLAPARQSDADISRGEVERLFLTPDGTTLVSVVCSGEACRLRSLDVASGAWRREVTGLDYGLVIAVTNDYVVTASLPEDERARCMTAAALGESARCPATVIDLSSGGMSFMGSLCVDQAAPVSGPHAGFAFASKHPACGEDLYAVGAVDLNAQVPMTVFEADDLALMLETLSPDAGVLSPDGTVVLLPGGAVPTGKGPVEATVIDTKTGEVVPNAIQ